MYRCVFVITHYAAPAYSTLVEQMDVTKKRISHILELKEILLSFRALVSTLSMLLLSVLFWRVSQA